MKTADFAAHLTEFLSHYLPELKNISTNTISSYCDAFRLPWLLPGCRGDED